MKFQNLFQLSLKRWAKLLPIDFAKRQTRYELGQQIFRARKAGASIAELELVLGLSTSRVKGIIRAAKARKALIAPIEAYYAAIRSDLFQLARKPIWPTAQLNGRLTRLRERVASERDKLAALEEQLLQMEKFKSALEQLEENSPAFAIARKYSIQAILEVNAVDDQFEKLLRSELTKALDMLSDGSTTPRTRS